MAKTESQELSFLADISQIVSHSHDLQETLDNIVARVADRMAVEVCTVYLLDENEEQLTLRATVGLDRAAVGQVHMGVGEGLTGLVVEEMRAVEVKEAKTHPRYKFFKETHEEPFHSYLGVPLIERRRPIGVLAIQTAEPRQFDPDEVRLLETIASQVTGLITTSRMLELLEHRSEDQKALDETLRRYEKEGAGAGDVKESRHKSVVLRGHAASPGFRMGNVHILQHEFHLGSGYAETAEDTEHEKKRLAEAFEKSITEVSELKSQVTSTLSEQDSAIFHGHLLMLEDKGFRQRIEEVIDEKHRAEFAVEVVAGIYKERLSRFDDVYLRERVIDIEDVERRLLRNLLGIEREVREFDEDSIVVADDIRPSELMYLDSPRLKGVVLARGGVTSHVAILAKSMDLPMVVGVSNVLADVSPGDFMILDGNSGAVYINPGQDVISEYVRLEAAHHTLIEELRHLRDLPAQTLDGHFVRVEANVSLCSEIPIGLDQGAQGVGLYRTEFPFLSMTRFPTEGEQYDILIYALKALRGAPLTIRTLDIGGEKTPQYFPMPAEPNPLLGWRSMRLVFDHPEILETQLRAIVRAALISPIRVMFPMISGIDDIRIVKELLRTVARKVGGTPQLKVGAMVEVPSAVTLADHLAREVDFFSIGTNDLTQYILAVDRNNPKVSDLYEELHPAVLMAVDRSVRAAHNAGITVTVCGEMAGTPSAAILLVGMGVDSLSMTPNLIPFVKRVVRSLTRTNAEALVRDVLRLSTTREVKEHIERTYAEWGITDLLAPEGSRPH